MRILEPGEIFTFDLALLIVCRQVFCNGNNCNVKVKEAQACKQTNARLLRKEKGGVLLQTWKPVLRTDELPEPPGCPCPGSLPTCSPSSPEMCYLARQAPGGGTSATSSHTDHPGLARVGFSTTFFLHFTPRRARPRESLGDRAWASGRLLPASGAINLRARPPTAATLAPTDSEKDMKGALGFSPWWTVTLENTIWLFCVSPDTNSPGRDASKRAVYAW